MKVKVLLIAANETVEVNDAYAERLFEQGKAVFVKPEKKAKGKAEDTKAVNAEV